MFEFLSSHSDKDAIVLIKKDHDKVKELFEQFEEAKTLAAKKKIVADTLLELKLHAAIEEEIFYAVVRPQIEKKIMNEADEEHHVAKLLIAELEEMDGTESHYDAKYKVLSENIRHHIREEESDLLPKARDLDINYELMGERITARKAVLKKKGVPVFGEETMVAKSRGQGDSPAQAAKTTKPVAPYKASKPAPKSKSSKIIKLTGKAKALPKKIQKESCRREEGGGFIEGFCKTQKKQNTLKPYSSVLCLLRQHVQC